MALGERLERASSAAEMLENVLQAVQQLTNATACGIFVRQSNGRLLSVCAIGAKADALQGLDLSTERLMQEVLRTGSPALCHNLLSQPEDAVGPLALAGFQTAIALPLSRLQGVGGVLLVVDGRCEITEKRLPLLTVLAVQAAEIIPAVQAMPNGSALADEFVTLQKLLRNAP